MLKGLLALACFAAVGTGLWFLLGLIILLVARTIL